MFWKIMHVIWIIGFGFLFAGCNSENTQTTVIAPLVGQSVPIVYQATPTIEAKMSIIDQRLELRNCSGDVDLHQFLAAHAQVSLKITIPDKATPTTSGSDLELTPEITTALEENIKMAYQTVYEAEVARVEQTDILVPIAKIRTFTIYWKQQTFSSTVAFTLDDIIYTIPYTYTLDLPFITIAQEISCTG
jgi:hypothetical protein